MKTNIKNYCIAIIGLGLIAASIIILRTSADLEGIFRTLPYIFIGIGCGAFGQSLGEIINKKALKKRPDIQKQMEIDKNDERNVLIANKAKAKAYDIMIFVFGALLLSFALMQVDMIAVLLLVFAYLFVIFYGVYYRFKYDKEM